MDTPSAPPLRVEAASPLHVESSSVSTPVVASILCMYVFYRSISTPTPTINIIKGKGKSIAGLLLRCSILSAAVYNITLHYLSTKFQIDKIALELFGHFESHYVVSYGIHKVDLRVVLLSALKAADILFVSCIFMCVALVAPSVPFSPYARTNRTISILSNTWAILRMPLVYYSGLLGTVISEKLALFLMLLFYNMELVAAFVLLVTLRFRNAGLKGSTAETGFFTVSVFLYGFMKYSINYIDFPFKLDSNTLNLIYSGQYALMISLYLMMTGIIFPRSGELGRAPEKLEVIRMGDVAMVEEVIEFEDASRLLIAG